MERGQDSSSGEGNTVHHHYHYHYHYHYPPNQIPDTMSQVHSQAYLTPQGRRQKVRTQQPEFYTSRHEAEEWKRQIDPEVTRKYEDYQAQTSRFSDHEPSITQNLEESYFKSPRRSDMRLSAPRSSVQLGVQSKASRLDELYYLQRQQRIRQKQEVQTGLSQITRLSEETDREEEYKKQIERLKRYEEECFYLRDKFVHHVENRHLQELKK